MMKTLGLNEIRKKFLDYFEKQDHLRLESFSLVPQGDASLFLINAGMAPLKDYFLGEKKMSKNRATSSQRCVRTQDIDEVGKTDRHATFFEMLGNFSFGDYFKKEAIHWALEFLTKEIGLDQDKLWITVYKEDDEAYDLWRKEGIREERILKLGKEDNFWELDQGPCGPCSEIHYDRGSEFGEGASPLENSDRVMEIWNLVFTQFDRKADGSYEPLANPNIDTGMGLERLALICENKANIFTLKEFVPFMKKIEGDTKKKYGENAKEDESFRVIIDHTKAMTFLTLDGVVPSNVGRGYILRRLIRRAYRHGKLLGLEGEFLSPYLDQIMDIYEEPYPELKEQRDRIHKVIIKEEEQFQKTIDQGLSLLSNLIAALKEKGEKTLSGEDAFKLYDTYGFPIDLTKEIAKEEDIETDLEAFKEYMEARREESRAKGSIGSGFHERKELDLTGLEETEFIGYDLFQAKAKVLALYKENERVDELKSQEEGILVVDRSPFYAESGGQLADIGEFTFDLGQGFVKDCQKNKDNIFFHFIQLEEGVLKQGDIVHLAIDPDRRMDITRNHSATHLLHKALKMVLGDHVHQAGSFVSPDRLRFDFSHFERVTDKELEQIEKIVNEVIFASYPVSIVWKSLEEAMASGAQGLFEDKYGDEVRVVSMGDFSKELCGGCHVENTSQVSMFHILLEEAVSSGVRRIEAITGRACYRDLKKKEETLADLAILLKTNTKDLRLKLEKELEERKELERQLSSFQSKLANEESLEMKKDLEEVSGINLLVKRVDKKSMDDLKELVDHLKENIDHYVIFLASAFEGRVSLVCSVDDPLTKKGISAGKLVKHIAQELGGNGGGRPNFATAGAKDASKLDEALKLIPAWLKQNIEME